MAFDYAAFKARWRELAAERGIDPVEGATAFQAVAVQTEERKRTHYARQREAVRANAEMYTPDHRYQTHEHLRLAGRAGRWSAVPILRTARYLHWDNGNGLVDYEKVTRAERRDWWVDPDIWILGKSRFTVKVRVEAGTIEMNGVIAATEVQAVRNLRSEARRLRGQGEEMTQYEQMDWALRRAAAEVHEMKRLERLAHEQYLAGLPVQMEIPMEGETSTLHPREKLGAAPRRPRKTERPVQFEFV